MTLQLTDQRKVPRNCFNFFETSHCNTEGGVSPAYARWWFAMRDLRNSEVKAEAAVPPSQREHFGKLKQILQSSDIGKELKLLS